MRVVREGITRPSTQQLWWAGRVVKCSDCGFAAELSEDDAKPSVNGIVIRDKTVTLPCPTKDCNGTARLSLDESRFYASAGVERR